MQLHTLSPKHAPRKSIAVGRGGTRGKTSGRGTKGQSARAGNKKRPEARDIIKKLPKLRGHGKNRSHTVRRERLIYTPVNLSALEAVFSAGDTVSPQVLLSKGLVRAQKGRAPKVKILGFGAISKGLVIDNCAMSVSAKDAIEKAGGTIKV